MCHKGRLHPALTLDDIPVPGQEVFPAIVLAEDSFHLELRLRGQGMEPLLQFHETPRAIRDHRNIKHFVLMIPIEELLASSVSNAIQREVLEIVFQQRLQLRPRLRQRVFRREPCQGLLELRALGVPEPSNPFIDRWCALLHHLSRSEV
jgi:hypothetical protein